MEYDTRFLEGVKRNAARYSEKDLICSSVYYFAQNLPDSIDYCNPNFVPGNFIHMVSQEKNGMIWRYGDSIHQGLVGEEGSDQKCGTHITNGNLLQICFLLQRILIGYVEPTAKSDDVASCYKLRPLPDKAYNQRLLEELSSLPEYCRVINSAPTYSERKIRLKEIYEHLLEKIGLKHGLDPVRGNTMYVTPVMDLNDFYALDKYTPKKSVEIMLEATQKECFFELVKSSGVIDKYRELVERGNQLHSIRLTLMQKMKTEYGMTDMDCDELFNKIGLEFSQRKTDVLKRVRKKRI